MTEILDEAAVSEIEAAANGNVKEPGTYMFLLSRVLPLCATVKHLRAERVRLLDLVRYCRHQLHEEGLITTDDLAALLEAGPESVRRLESYDDLQSQLEQLRAENGRLREQVVEAEKAAERWFNRRY